MLSKLKKYIKKSLHIIGIEAHRFQPNNSQLSRLITALRTQHIDIVIDIGANEGQFSEELRAGGYKGAIISFEPMADAHSKLLNRSQHDSNWQVAPRAAIGAGHGVIELNVSSNSVSSSVLPMLEAHRQAAPESAYNSRESVPLLPIDEAAENFLSDKHNILLKIDTQGYEWEVLNGATNLLKRARAVLIELSLTPLYENQHLWLECVARLENAGFTLWALEPAFIDLKTGRTLQMDGLFIKA